MRSKSLRRETILRTLRWVSLKSPSQRSPRSYWISKSKVDWFSTAVLTDIIRTEEISTSAVLELIKARVDTLERLELSEFADLPQELVESLQKCQALTRLQLKDTNLTLKDVINVLEFVKVKILSVPGTFLIWKLVRVVDFNIFFFHSHQRDDPWFTYQDVVLLKRAGLEYLQGRSVAWGHGHTAR